MTKKEITLFFAQALLTLKEDPRGFEKYCKREAQKRWTGANPEKKRAADAAYYEEHKEECDTANRAYAEENPERVRGHKRKHYEANRQTCIDRAVKWNRDNRERRNARASISGKLKRDSDPQFKLRKTLATRVWWALQNAGGNKTAPTLELLGVKNTEIVWAHLESLFRPGMTRENYGSVWEIDHKKPCASFNLLDPAQQRACFHYSNLQPLLVSENRSKGAKV
jgi:hypothetical protein